MHKWLEWRTTKTFCVTLALLFAAEQAVWGADMNALQALQLSGEQQHRLDVARSAAILTAPILSSAKS